MLWSCVGGSCLDTRTLVHENRLHHKLLSSRVIFVKILGIDPVVTCGMLDEIVPAMLGEPLVGGEAQAIEPPEKEFEGEQQDKDDRYGNSNRKHGKAILRVRQGHCRRGYAWWSIISAHSCCDRKRSHRQREDKYRPELLTSPRSRPANG